MRRLLFALAAWLLIGCADTSEQSATSATSTSRQKAEAARARLSASEGGRLVLRAIEAHGGLEAWYSAPTSAYGWEYSNVDSEVRFKSHLVADNNTRQVYHELVGLGTPDDLRPFTGRFA